MTYAHALGLNADRTSPFLTAACNADAQHWPTAAGDVARTERQALVIRPDGVVGDRRVPR